MLIDDNVAYALECAAAGIHVLLYDWEGGYPWSKLPLAHGKEEAAAEEEGCTTRRQAAPERVTVVRSWDQVIAEVGRLSQQLLRAEAP